MEWVGLDWSRIYLIFQVNIGKIDDSYWGRSVSNRLLHFREFKLMHRMNC